MVALKAQQFTFRFAHKFSSAEFEVALIGGSQRGAEHAAKAQIARQNKVAAYKLELVTCKVATVEVEVTREPEPDKPGPGRRFMLRKEVQAIAARRGVTPRELWYGLAKPTLRVKLGGHGGGTQLRRDVCACGGPSCGSELCGVLTAADVRRSHIVQIWEDSTKLPAVCTAPVARFWEDRRDGMFYGSMPHQAYRIRDVCE